MSEQVMWFDTETTGLDTSLCGIVEVGAIFQNPGQKTQKFEQLANPFASADGSARAVEVSDYAFRVNGIDKESLGQHPSIDNVVTELDSFVQDKCVIAGWNVSGFDIPMLKAAYERAGLRWRYHYHVIDVMNVAKWMQHMGKLRSHKMGLQAVAEFLGIDSSQYGDAHRALADVWTTIAVSKELNEKFLGGMKVRF